MTLISPTSTDSRLDQRLASILDDYFRKLELGNAPDRQTLLEQHPDIADDLESCFASIDFIGIAGIEAIGSSELVSTDSNPKRLGNFIIKREIGRGGMGVVYEAEDTELGRDVAVKVLPFAAMLDEQRLKRFHLEAQAAASLTHPNIVPVHSIGRDSGVHFYVMDLIDGPSFDAVVSSIRDNDQSRSNDGENGDTACALSTDYSTSRKAYFRRIAELGRQTALALEFAHQANVVHRDIKPSNLLLDSTGKLVITDFGLARTTSDMSVSRSNEFAGTLRYMSPEQAAGKRTIIDGRTDVYSLGATLYELLVLRPAFQGTDQVELLAQVTREEPVPISKLDSQIPRELETIVHKAMAKEPEQRYDTAQAFADDLQNFLESRPIIARRSGRVQRTWSWVRRNRVVAGLTAALILALSAFAVGSSVVAVKYRQDLLAERYAAYARDIRLCQHLVDDGQYIEAENKLLTLVPDNASDDLRDFEWYYLWRKSHRSGMKQTIRHKLAVFDVAYVDGGNKLAVARWANTIDIWDLDSQDDFPVARLNARNTGNFTLTTIDDSNTLVAGDLEGKLLFWDLATHELTESIQFDLPSTARWIETISFSPDQRFVAVGAGNWCRGFVHVRDRDEQKCVAQLGEFQGSALATFVDETTLAVVAQGLNKLQLWSTSDWQLIREIDLQGTGVGAMALSPDKKTLVLGVHEKRDRRVHGRIELWNVKEWNQPQRFSVHNDIIRSVEFSPDGNLIAAYADDRFISVLDRRTNNVKLTQTGNLGRKGGLAFSSDGQTLAASGNDGTVNVWDVAKLLSPDQAEIVLQVNESTFAGIEFLDATRICLSTKAGNVSVRKLSSDEETRCFDVVHETASMTQMAISSDRRFLAVARTNWPRKKQSARVEIHDLENESLHSVYKFPKGIIYTRSSFSPDLRYLAVCGKEKVFVVDIVAQTVAYELQSDQRVKSTAFSPDGRLLACADLGGETHLFETDRFSMVRKIRTDSTLTDGVDFSPDGKTIATVGFDRCVKLFDTRSGKLLREFTECANPLGEVRFSPNGKRLVTGGMFGKARVWDVQSGEELLTFNFFPAFYTKPRFSPDGKSLAVKSGPTAKVLQGADPEELSCLSISELTDIVCQDLNVIDAD